MSDTARPRPWFARPKVVLPLVGVAMLAVAVSTPEYVLGRAGDARVSLRNRGPLGAKLFGEFARAAGWRVEERLRPTIAPDSTVVHALLSPGVPVRQDEVHALLEAVRGGAGLLVSLDGSTASLEDSLRIRVGPGATIRPSAVVTADCPSEGRIATPTLWPDGQAHLYGITFRGPRPAGVERLDRALVSDTATSVRALGFPFGRGRIVVLSDPDIVRNDALRVCRFGLDVTIAAALGYVARRDDGTLRTTLRVDEYHQGYGERSDAVGGFLAILRETRGGRAFAVLLLAGVLALVARMPRDILPRDDRVIERRSPLEQVDALARAYSQVGATRTATMRLLHGVRRRTRRAAVGRRTTQSDTEFLDRVVAHAPERAADVERVRAALKQSSPARELAAVAAALERIEVSLTSLP